MVVMFVCLVVSLEITQGQEAKIDGTHAGGKLVHQLKFVTYNVLADSDQAEQRVPALMKILRESRADVIALQEVAPWFVQMLRKEEWVRDFHVEDGGSTSLFAREFLILSRFPIEAPRYYDLAGSTGRGVLIARIKAPGFPFEIATVHLESPLEAGEVRSRQLDRVFELLKNHEDAVFLGDFNFGDAEKPDTAHLSPTFQDVWKTLFPDDPGYTWNIEKSGIARRSSFPAEKSRRLDRILVRFKKWKAESAAILGDKPVVEGQDDVFPSDHFGLTATVRREADQE